ncbi:hypothetical protein E1B28_001414 [Marasmius oreades]|uniref:Uncharacterized protein n=1 Tax=Marasmius oreades TaxID=181124 RepID=A0A9P8AFE8_9AGAR|nr:uncharacterized protein E1B28_001414 [Marasmius oreades]KAG7099584.1 hypothetical protein E1B28_001414 [Marasmius oreades]
MSTAGIFNVQETQGAEKVKLETTAAAAQVEAKTSEAARTIENNADQAQYAAGQAAAAAKSLGNDFTGEPTSAMDQLQYTAKQTTDAAVNEGHRDVEAAKATGEGYVNQVKNMAANAAASVNATVQPYIAGFTGATDSTSDRSAPNGANQSGVISQLQSGAAVAVQTGREYVAAAKPHIDKATTAAQNYLHSIQDQGSATTGAPPGQVPATTAPLESGPHTVGSPYGATKDSTVGDVSKTV